MRRLALLAAFSALVAVPVASRALASPAPDEPAPGTPPVVSNPAADPEPGARRAPVRGRFARADARAHARRDARRFLRSLDLTDAQKATVLEARAASAKVRHDAHAAVREAVRAARAKGDRSEAARAALREEVRGVRASARQAVEPQARRVLESLTPEQRAAIEARAKAHGRTADDAALLRRIEGLLLRRGGRR